MRHGLLRPFGSDVARRCSTMLRIVRASCGERGVVLAEDARVPRDAFGLGLRAHGCSADEGHVVACRLVERRKDRLGDGSAAEGVVEAGDERGLRAEVGGEAQRREAQLAEALLAHGAQEALHARLAEEIDGLLRVADEEERL